MSQQELPLLPELFFGIRPVPFILERSVSMKKCFALILAILMLAPVLSGCGTKSTEFNEDKIVFQFGAVSDTQHGIKWIPIDTYGRSEYAFEQLRDLALQYNEKGLDAILFSGDLVNDSKTAQLQGFAEIYENVFDPAEVPLIFSLGNHDVKHNPSSNREELHLEDYYIVFGQEYRSYDKETSRIDLGCVHQVVGDYHFLALGPMDSGWEYNEDGSANYDPAAVEWLDQTLAEITKENPNRYVFLSTHPLIYDTAYGSDLIYSTMSWNTRELTAVLEKYPQVVTFGGHVHFSINDERSIMQTSFTSLQCGAVSYMATDPGNYRHMLNGTVMKDCTKVSTGYLVQIDNNGNVRFLRVDFFREGLIKEPWVISAPQEDGSHLLSYTKDRGNAENNPAPAFPANPIVVEDDSNSRTAGEALKPTLVFQSATDDDQVYKYTVEVTENGQTVENINLLADFYLHTSPDEMRSEWRINLERDTYYKGHTYVITVTAADSWGAVSETVSYTYQPQ